MLIPPPTKVQQGFGVTDAGYPEAGRKAFGLTLLPMMAQPIVPIFNLGPSVPTLVPCPAPPPVCCGVLYDSSPCATDADAHYHLGAGWTHAG